MEWFELPHQLTYYECDPQGNLQLGMLFNLGVLAAEIENQGTGVGLGAANELGGGWVVVNYAGTFDLTHFHAGDQIVVATRVKAFNKFFSLREFSIRDQSGHEWVHYEATFVFMDLVKRRIMTIPPVLIEQYDLAPVKRIPRVPTPSDLVVDDTWQQHQYDVRYFDIDMNGHVNNSHYFDWMLEALGAEFLQTHQLTGVKIQFDHEVRYGQRVTSQVKVADLVTYHQIKTADQGAARAELTWVPVEK